MGLRILDLCGGSGNWSRPYADAGYEVDVLDLRTCADVRMYPFPKGPIHGILCAPPCTVFSCAGNGTFRSSDDYLDGLSVVDACLRFVAMCRPSFWALENPNGTLSRWLGPSVMSFHPCTYGHPYTKLTQLWGSFNRPLESPVEPSGGSWVRVVHDPAKRAETFPGFASAFFAANP